MVLFKDIEISEIDFIPKDEYVIGIDKTSSDVLLFTQNINTFVNIYSLGKKLKLQEINVLCEKIISAKLFNSSDEFLLTPFCSAGQIFIYGQLAEPLYIIPKINCNKGYVRSANFFEHKIYYVFPNNIINSDIEGHSPFQTLSSVEDMYIDTSFAGNYQAVIYRRNNSYWLDMYENHVKEATEPLSTGFIPSSAILVPKSENEVLNVYIAAMFKGKSYVIRYIFSLE